MTAEGYTEFKNFSVTASNKGGQKQMARISMRPAQKPRMCRVVSSGRQRVTVMGWVQKKKKSWWYDLYWFKRQKRSVTDCF